MTPTFSSTMQHRLEIVDGGGPVVAQRVLVPEGAEEGSHLLSWRVAGAWTSAAVEVVACPQVPPRVVVVTDELAVELDLDPAACDTWRLDPKPPVRASRITLELATEREPQEVARQVARSALIGRLLWLPPDGREVWLSVDGVPHRVREVDVGGRTGVIAELTASTTLELYAPAARAGVDIVVLADGSSSMAVDDLPLTGKWATGPGGAGWAKRINALKEALNDLLTMRLQIGGRTSRIALLEFGESVSHRFPKQGGMAQLDADSPADVAAEFRSAVAQLRATSPKTDIGNALHEAANLLYQYGRPGNDKLVVLVSDGAEWRPKGDEGTGEVVCASDEPVSLMAHLHQDMGIKLHAVGISTEDLLRRRGSFEMRPALVPNHTLLGELVKVGGGDPTTIGGLDALESYFSGLGAGVVHRVSETPRRLPARAPLSDATLAALRRLAGPEHDWDAERAGLHDELGALVGECGSHAERVLGRLPWKPNFWSACITRDFGVTVTDDLGLTRFLLGISGAFAPEAEVLGRARSLTPWAALMNELREAAPGGAPDYGRLSRACGAVLQAAAQAQVEVLRQIRAGLTDLRDELMGHGPAQESAADTPAAAPDPAAGAPSPKYTFRYLD